MVNLATVLCDSLVLLHLRISGRCWRLRPSHPRSRHLQRKLGCCEEQAQASNEKRSVEMIVFINDEKTWFLTAGWWYKRPSSFPRRRQRQDIAMIIVNNIEIISNNFLNLYNSLSKHNSRWSNNITLWLFKFYFLQIVEIRSLPLT